jgi:hypothetical protein
LLILGITPSGRFFVEAALFADIFHCDAVATEPSLVRIYPKQAVLKALQTDPANAMSFLTLMAHQMIELRQRLEVMKVRSAKERVLVYLDLNSELDGRMVNLRSQLKDIASELGLSREAFYRTLASLETGRRDRAGRSSYPAEKIGCRLIERLSVEGHSTAILALGVACWLGERVGRDAQGVAMPRQPAAMSLSGHIPVPQCRWRGRRECRAGPNEVGALSGLDRAVDL